jgi:hypothetical protein
VQSADSANALVLDFAAIDGDAPDGSLAGTPASAGSVSGTARVIFDPVGARLQPRLGVLPAGCGRSSPLRAAGRRLVRARANRFAADAPVGTMQFKRCLVWFTATTEVACP